MLRVRVSTLAPILLIPALVATLAPTLAYGQGPQSPEAKERAAQYAAADVRVLTPGVIYNAGLLDLMADYTKQTGKKVGLSLVGMGRIFDAALTLEPPPDVIMLPHELMSNMSLDGGIKAGTFTPLGRSEMGLAVPAGAPHPDISTVEKLAAALRSAKKVMRSNTSRGSMVALVIENKVIKRPEFAGVNSEMSTRGEGGQALARGEGDMAIQAICEIYPHKEIELVGPMPRELGAWIDMSTAVSARAEHPDDGLAFIKYMLRPESTKVWKAKGLERFQ